MKNYEFACPKCEQLYKVKSESLNEGSNHFECHKCHQEFSMDFVPAESLLMYGDITQDPIRDCPKCNSQTDSSKTDCQVCGVVFDKYELIKKDAESFDRTSPELASAWMRVINDFDNPQVHTDFINIARRKRGLDYANQRYDSLSEALNDDPRIEEMKRRIQTLLRVDLARESKSAVEGVLNWKLALQVVPLFLGGLMILAGLTSQGLGNLTGFGAMLTLVCLGILAHIHGYTRVIPFR
jgi:hypothetical protein